MHQIVLQRRATVPFQVAAAPQHTVMQYSTRALVQARHAAILAAALPDLSVATFDHQGADLLGGPAKRIRSPSSSKPAPVGLAWHPGMPLLVTAWADESLTFSVFYLDGSLHYQKILPPPKRQQTASVCLLEWLSNSQLLVANNCGQVDIVDINFSSDLDVDWEPLRVRERLYNSVHIGVVWLACRYGHSATVQAAPGRLIAAPHS